MFSTAREPEAEALLKAGMARPVGKGVKIRGLQLACSRKQAHTFLRRGRSLGQANKTSRVERVGDQRRRLFVHDVERCLSFRPEISIAAAPEVKPAEPQEPGDTCEQLPAVDNSCAVHLERREEIAEKEPDRAADEPTTPEVAVPAKPPQHTTHAATPSEPDPHDMSALRKLGAAVAGEGVKRMRGATAGPVSGLNRHHSRCWNSGAGSLGWIVSEYETGSEDRQRR